MKRSVAAVMLAGLVFGAGIFAGRMSVSPGLLQAAGSLPGDRALERAWDGFLQRQGESLALLQESEFYGDAQERAEAFHALITDIAAALDPSPGFEAGALLGELPPRENPSVPLTPNAMAARLALAGDRLEALTRERLQRARQAFDSAVAGDIVIDDGQGVQAALHHWELGNDQALLVHFPSRTAGAGIALGNVWAMGLQGNPAEGRPVPVQACEGAAGCRLVLSHRDPRLPGWLNTGGHRRGLLLLYRDAGQAIPTTQVVSFQEVATPIADDAE